MLQIVNWFEYWENIEDGVNEINEQHEHYHLSDLISALRKNEAFVLLDVEQPDEFYIIMPIRNKTTGENIMHVWMGYSKRGGFLRRTVTELEQTAVGMFRATYITFETVKDKQFDELIKRGVIEGYEKLPVAYKKRLLSNETNT